MLDKLGTQIYCNEDEESEIDNLVLESEFQFYLTGSHYFGMALPYSDIDLVAEWSRKLENWLQNQGYEILGQRQNPYFEDQNVMAVYRKKTSYSWIDIQLSTDITKKLLIQEILKKAQVFTMGRVHKSQAKYIWRAMYMLYE